MKTFLKTLLSYKLALVILMVIIAFVAGSLKLREILINSSSTDKQTVSFDDYLPLPTDIPSSNSALTASPSPTQAVLGTSTSTGVIPTLVPIPTSPGVPTYAPIPTTAPLATANTSSSSSCSGTPNADASQVYVSPSSTAINNASTVSVELRDCNNNLASNDNLTITLTSGDATTTTINNISANSPYKAQAQNGKYSFQVNAQNPSTATFNIQDDSHNFQVTMPGYKTPKVTFISSSPSSSICTTGRDAAYYSYARYPAGSVAVGSNVTITIDLRDCNNQATLGSDTITVTPKSVDSTFRFVGFGSGSFTLPQGQTSFQVTSSNPGTNTFTIRDTTGGFDVTGPNYATPNVTFTGSSPTSTPNPTPTGTLSPQPTIASPSATVTL